ncbi:MAG: hypothetical protein MI919_37795 [Holophagales bacterium]|nr:hypothetical protein [Holophagales bacterium]
MTLEIAAALLSEVEEVAEREGTTSNALVEEGLRKLLEERRGDPEFRLRKASFAGNGLRSGIREGDWDTIRGLCRRDPAVE